MECRGAHTYTVLLLGTEAMGTKAQQFSWSQIPLHACFKQFTKHTLTTPSVKEHMHCMLLGTEVEAASPNGIPGIPPTIASYNIQDK